MRYFPDLDPDQADVYLEVHAPEIEQLRTLGVRVGVVSESPQWVAIEVDTNMLWMLIGTGDGDLATSRSEITQWRVSMYHHADHACDGADAVASSAGPDLMTALLIATADYMTAANAMAPQ
ncbi:hypothetical protein [Nocardia sp. NPDC060249]|uniref:hypothetical protein n=1 Tax=Nocardia sp. NPDC060249 TaxID=3347082 RepID=UPI00364781B1